MGSTKTSVKTTAIAPKSSRPGGAMRLRGVERWSTHSCWPAHVCRSSRFTDILRAANGYKIVDLRGVRNRRRWQETVVVALSKFAVDLEA
jgi:hypothetical protein